MKFILPSGHKALIDAEDWDLVRPYAWYASIRPEKIYVVASYWNNGSIHTIKLHRLILHASADMQVDHRNHNGLDNQRTNLRLATSSQNGGNTRIGKNNTSGYKGVSWRSVGQKWEAKITINMKSIYLGRFTDPWEAAQAYNTAALEAWGKFALINTRLPD